jgi:aminopeptidase N
MTKSVKRLYAELKPSHYELELRPNADSFSFKGTVTIDLKKTGRPSQRLTFHQVGLKIDHATVTKHDKQGSHELTVTRINNQNSLHEVRLHTSDMVYAGDYQIQMSFSGKISRGMTGLYPCFFNYKDAEHVLLATQFESHFAREVFPSIDEPEAKATFHLTLITPPHQEVLSNTPIEKQQTNGELMSTTFEQTPRMSTYLLAFVIGEMHNVATKTARGTEVRVWATVAQPKAALDFALDVAKRSIEFFENYFGVDYPLQKADHVALPDFSMGAMENWGLITYRERVLLAYPGQSSQSTKEVIATVIAHETSHQWFGNLVTMSWWDDLWLNESFANMMEYEAVDSMFPEWHVWDSFTANEGLGALRRDATPGVQAVKTSVHHPDEINTLFDPSIVYAKGGRLLNMLKTYIGIESFKKGLTEYFTKHAYSNTTGDDLWQALHTSSGIDVAAFMNPWLERSGFPVVTVDQTDKQLTLHQTHFLESGEASDGRIWPVPLLSNRDKLPQLLSRAELKSKLQTTGPPVLLNQGSSGHFIVHYAQAAHRDFIIDQVAQKKLSVSDRLMVLNSASMLAKAGYQSFGDVLALLQAYRDESSEMVWSIMARIIAETRRFIDHDERLETPIKALVQQLIQAEYARLDWHEKDEESSSDRKLRAIIIGLGVYAEDPAVIKEALTHYQNYVDKPDSLNPELRSIVLSVPIRRKVAGAFEFLLKQHDDTDTSDVKTDIMTALTQTKDAAEAEILLSRLKDASIVKPQDAEYWLIYLLGNRFVREQAWQWMEQNWSWIEKTYDHDKSYDDYPRYSASICNTNLWAKKYAAFFKPKEKELTLKRNILIGLSEIATRVAWLERDLESVKSFFK